MKARERALLCCASHALQVLIVAGAALSLLASTSAKVRSVSLLPDRDRANFPTWDRTAESATVFAQISDLHVGRAPEWVRRFETFVTEVLTVVRPELVLATGDLVDSQPDRGHTAEQYESQWVEYARARTLSGRPAGVPQMLVELLGNHDVYKTWTPVNPQRYTETGETVLRKLRVLNFTSARTNRSLEFILLDSNVKGSLWSNALGHVSLETARGLDRLIREAGARGRRAVVVAHHPLTDIMLTGLLNDLLSWLGPEVDPLYSYHVCGHLHPVAYVRHGRGPVELAVESIGKYGGYRLLVDDNGLLSFSECRVGVWPVAVITTPKSATFLVESEPNSLVPSAGQVRIVAYSPSGIVSVSVALGGGAPINLTSSVSFPALWTANCSFGPFTSGLHQLTARITDGSGSVLELSQPFSLDGSLAGGKTKFLLKIKVRLWMCLWLPISVFLGAAVILPRFLVPLLVRSATWQNLLSGIRSVEREDCSLGQLLGGLNIGLPRKVLVVLFWQPLSTAALWSQVPFFWWACAAVLYAVHFALPTVISARGGVPTMVGWSWGSLVKSSFVNNELLLGLSCGYLVGVLYPTLCVLSALHARATRPATNKARVAFLPSPWQCLLCGLILLCSCGIAIGVPVLFAPLSLATSPLVYEALASPVLVASFIVLQCRAPTPKRSYLRKAATWPCYQSLLI